MTTNGCNRTTKSRKIRTDGEKETYEYLEILEAYIKHVEMKRSKSIPHKNEKLLESKQ